jgi:hypothetical protein
MTYPGMFGTVMLIAKTPKCPQTFHIPLFKWCITDTSKLIYVNYNAEQGLEV